MISVLLPVYNGEKYLAKSIKSVLDQGFKDFELLIGFNGTIDASKEIARSYEDDRIRMIDYGMDRGKGRTLNKMLKEAKFDIIALQDDDDIWLPEKLSRQMEFIKEFDIVGTQLNYIDENDFIIKPLKLYTDHENIKYAILTEGDNHIANTSAIFKKKLAININGWSEVADGIEDLDFWIRMLKAGGKVKNLSFNLLHHRIHKNSNFNVNQYDVNSIL
jgi:glycosyltransferase involved in cell wall biosynthesis